MSSLAMTSGVRVELLSYSMEDLIGWGFLLAGDSI